jgi:hypothetical protein
MKKKLVGTLVSVHTSSKDAQPSVKAELDGFVGEKYSGFTRVAYEDDVSPEGTVRRNERQWSGVSVEELAVMQRKMDLKEPLMAGTLRANICLKGISDFSKLPKGTKLIFPSGAVLVVEEENPPCDYMGDQIAAKHTTNSGKPITGDLFLKHAAGLRGVVGVVDVPGVIEQGDKVIVEVYEA